MVCNYSRVNYGRSGDAGMGNIEINTLLKFKYLKGNNGSSLVELIVAITLILIVLVVGFTFFSFGLNSFSSGELHSNVQQNVRLNGKYISDEVRYATEMEILVTKPSVDQFDNRYNYIYLDDGKIMIKKGAQAACQVPADISDGIEFTLEFWGNAVDTSMLNFVISGQKDGGQKYEVSSEVSVLNLSYIQNINGTAIKYRDKVFLVIRNTDLNYCISGAFYKHEFIARGGNPPYSFTDDGALPSGLTLNSNGVLSGNPNNEGDFTFKVTVTDDQGDTSSHEFALQVKPPKLGASIETDLVSGNMYMLISNIRDAATIKLYRVNEPEPIYTVTVEGGDTYIIDLENDIYLPGDYYATQTVNDVTSEQSNVIGITT